VSRHQGSDLDRVIAEIAHVLTSTRPSTDDKVGAITALERVNTQVAIKALRIAVDSSNINLRLRALAALLKKNDISKLDIAASTLLNEAAVSDQFLYVNLAGALRSVRNPDAIPVMIRLLESPAPHVRRAATSAIRNSGVDAAISPLAKALHDSDREVRYQAVIGLAEITGQDNWGPSVDLYARDEQRYLGYWQDWAKRR
jgi:HEAT repeat protein